MADLQVAVVMLVDRQGRILMQHRDANARVSPDQWGLPGGRVEEGETPVEAARREVHEETGIRCELDADVGTTEYTDSRGRPKQVRWWTMRPIASDGFEQNDEVDEIRWLTPRDAARLLSYERDLPLLDLLS